MLSEVPLTLVSNSVLLILVVLLININIRPFKSWFPTVTDLVLTEGKTSQVSKWCHHGECW